MKGYENKVSRGICYAAQHQIKSANKNMLFENKNDRQQHKFYVFVKLPAKIMNTIKFFILLFLLMNIAGLKCVIGITLKSLI